MIPARETKSRWVVSVHDEALSDIPSTQMKDYADTRDISVLGIDQNTGTVGKTGKLATMFLIEPLRQKFANLADPQNRNSFTNQAVFAAHVVDSRNAPPDVVRRGDRLTDEALSSMPLEIIDEIATVIIELSTGAGRGVTTPFSLPVGYWDRKFEMSRLLAKAAQKAAEKIASGTSKATVEPAASV